jgi:hypothetical protein
MSAPISRAVLCRKVLGLLEIVAGTEEEVKQALNRSPPGLRKEYRVTARQVHQVQSLLREELEKLNMNKDIYPRKQRLTITAERYHIMCAACEAFCYECGTLNYNVAPDTEEADCRACGAREVVGTSQASAEGSLKVEG